MAFTAVIICISYLDKTIVYNPEFPHKIEFNKRGIQHTIYAKVYFINEKQFNRDFLISIFHLKDLLSTSNYLSKEIVRNKKETIEGIHIFVNTIFIDSRKYEVKIIVREVSVDAKQKNRHFFYDHSFIIRK
ncbi:MAG: hypothetical protein IIA88_05665 [Bacteroidetes bacterium]|nr:hypothetical protein [Bacteroidota bacterium]